MPSRRRSSNVETQSIKWREGEKKSERKKKKKKKGIRNVCCSWRILKIKLTRLSSNDPQFRVTLQVFGLQWLSNPRKKEPHQLTEGVPSDYVCVCERVPQNREEIRGSRKSLYIPFSFVRVCCWLCKLNPSKFFLLFFFCPATFSPLVFCFV